MDGLIMRPMQGTLWTRWFSSDGLSNWPSQYVQLMLVKSYGSNRDTSTEQKPKQRMNMYNS